MEYRPLYTKGRGRTNTFDFVNPDSDVWCLFQRSQIAVTPDWWGVRLWSRTLSSPRGRTLVQTRRPISTGTDNHHSLPTGSSRPFRLLFRGPRTFEGIVVMTVVITVVVTPYITLPFGGYNLRFRSGRNPTTSSGWRTYIFVLFNCV